MTALGGLDALRIDAGDALFLDFDGTLAEIVDDPDAARIDAETEAALARLCDRLAGALLVISGRDLRDLAGRTPATVWRAGAHGLETLPPGGTPAETAPQAPEAVLAPLESVAARPGVRLERKGPVTALHYRGAPTAEAACLEAARAAAAAAADHVAQPGKMVVEVKPKAANKGRALRAMADRPPFAGRRPVMIGDDRTDEDAMEAALALGGVAVKVGDGDTVARLRAPDPAAVRAWLRREAG